jgi:glycolate oxidase
MNRARMLDPDLIVSALRELAGDHCVSTDPVELRAAQADRSGFVSDSAPVCVISPDTVDGVSAVLGFANARGIPVVPRGAGSGVAGGAMGAQGEIVLSTHRLNRILSVDAQNLVARVEAGVLNGYFNSELKKQGLWYAPDPASREISSVGGNIATNAGGLMCAKYGVTHDAVLALTVVLADGSIIETGRATAKGVTGLDITSLMVGSEGTLGIVVNATVRIRRAVPGSVITVSAYFDSVTSAAQAAATVTAEGLSPVLMELMDPASLAAVHEYLQLDPAPVGASHLLLQTDGYSAEFDADGLERVLVSCGANNIARAEGEAAEELLKIRRSIHHALERMGTTLIEDVCVPRSALPEMFAAIERIGAKYSLTIPTVAHAGDGNLHPNFIFEGPDVPAHVWEAADEMFTTALRLGGTLTGEHGVGTLKRRWLEDEIGSRQFELQVALKNVFDPNGIMNPGKVFMPQ